MHKSIRALLTSAAAAAALAGPARAEDIDIYASPRGAAGRETVLLVLDNSANWSANITPDDCRYADKGDALPVKAEYGSRMGMEKCALYRLIDVLHEKWPGRFNVGLMLFNESPASSSGGYPRHEIAVLDAYGKESLKSEVFGLEINGDKSNNAAFAKGLYEAYLYLTEGAWYRGQANNSPQKWAPAAFSGANYALPAGGSCGKHVIFIANGRPGEVTDNEARELLRAASGDAEQFLYPPGTVSRSDQANWVDEFASFMNRQASIKTHAIAVTGASSDGNYPNFIANIADKGGGEYASVSNSQELVEKIAEIFGRIQSASSVFASASLPISLNARGTYLNQVFMGMFLPDEYARQRWHGNLKQFQFRYDPVTDSLYLADSENEPAINNSGGFVRPEAISFWTTPSDYWVNSIAIDPESDTPQSDSPDGKIVPKGGAAQRLRESHLTTQDGRLVLTCAGCSNRTALGSAANTLFNVDNSAIDSAALGVADERRELLIDWVRGQDNVPPDGEGRRDESGPGGEATVRPSIHGDVLHSRPAVVNYGEKGVVLFYGGNDGMLHALYGAQEGVDAGEHLWSFIPEEHFGKLRRLRDNSPRINFPNLLAGADEPPPEPRDYFVDGPVSYYQKVDDEGRIEKVYLYVGMRRGGRFLYAFDVTDPARPAFLWKTDPSRIEELGQSWSEARVVRIRGYRPNGVETPVIVMGAGYDPAEDQQPAGSAQMGAAVLVLDAFTGEEIATFPTERPVPADVSVVDSDYDGYVDRAYAVDLGGHVYRIDFEKLTPDGLLTDTSSWQVNMLASLGEVGSGKFFYAPDVVLTKSYAAILAGTGDREKPLLEDSEDYFYTIIDRELGKGVSGAFSTITFADLRVQEEYASAPEARGCYLPLAPGEKVVNAPLTIGGVTYFGTNAPTPTAANSCSNLGDARAYQLPLLCKAPQSYALEGGGLPPSPVGGVVEVAYTDPRTGETQTRHFPFIIGGENDKRSPIEGSRVKIAVEPKRSKIYWHTETER